MRDKPMLLWVTSDVSRANAGFRVRIAPLAEALRGRGVEVRVATYAELVAELPAWVQQAAAVVLSKPNDTSSFLCMRAFQDAGTPVAIDVFDNYLSWSPAVVRRELHWQLLRTLREADLVITSTGYLKRVLGTLRDGPLLRISDPLPSLPEGTSETAVPAEQALATKWPVRDGPLECIWFGIAGNDFYRVGLQDLDDWRDTLIALRDERADRGGIRLTLCTNRSSAVEATLVRLRREGIDARFVEWSEEACDQLLRATHLCLLPTNLSGFGLSKTHNRCTDALVRRNLVLASPHGPYVSMKGAVQVSLNGLLSLLRRIDADPTLLDQETAASLNVLRPDCDVSRHAERLSDRLLKTVRPRSPSNGVAPPVLVVGLARMEAIKLSRRLGYLTAGLATGLVQANVDIALHPDPSGPDVAVLSLTPKALEALRGAWNLDPTCDVLAASDWVEVRRQGWRLLLDRRTMKARLLSVPASVDLVGIREAARLAPPTPHRVRDWYDMMVDFLVQTLLGLGQQQLVYASDEGGGWSAFGRRADPGLVAAVLELHGLWSELEGREREWGSTRAAAVGVAA
jgi:hypothetical protein